MSGQEKLQLLLNYWDQIRHTIKVKVKVKVKFTLEQATKAQRGSVA
jgi:hypothetical protein